MRTIPLTLLSLTLALSAGACGSDDSGSSGSKNATTAAKGGASGAEAFKGCFELADYKAVTPDKTQESAFAAVARSRGFKTVAVNVVKGDEVLAPSAFLVFFDSDAEAQKAVAELKATTSGGAAPAQKGPAIIAYAYEPDKPKVQPVVERCL
jgi:hypothetical protein